MTEVIIVLTASGITLALLAIAVNLQKITEILEKRLPHAKIQQSRQMRQQGQPYERQDGGYPDLPEVDGSKLQNR